MNQPQTTQRFFFPLVLPVESLNGLCKMDLNLLFGVTNTVRFQSSSSLPAVSVVANSINQFPVYNPGIPPPNTSSQSATNQTNAVFVLAAEFTKEHLEAVSDQISLNLSKPTPMPVNQHHLLAMESQIRQMGYLPRIDMTAELPLQWPRIPQPHSFPPGHPTFTSMFFNGMPIITIPQTVATHMVSNLQNNGVIQHDPHAQNTIHLQRFTE